jgi:hypothetical protein
LVEVASLILDDAISKEEKQNFYANELDQIFNDIINKDVE